MADYPEHQRSTDSCMRKVVDAQLKNGFKTVTGASNKEFGRVPFARTDFSRNDPTAYEVVLVKACNALALTIVFAGHDRETVERFITATDLKVDPSCQ